MSNHNNEVIMEGLADEFYDDPKQCIEWICLWEAQNGEQIDVLKFRDSILALSLEQQCEFYVNKSIEVMSS